MLDKLILPDLKIAEMKGKENDCLDIISDGNTCEGCSGHCRDVAKAQLRHAVLELDKAGMLKHEPENTEPCWDTCPTCKLLAELESLR